MPDLVPFEATEASSNMPATVGTWTGNNTFTAKQTGWYLVDVQLVGNLSAGIPMLDFNGTGYSAASYYGTGSTNLNTASIGYKQRGSLQRLVYMTANQTFQIRALSQSPVVGADLGAGSLNYLRVTKL